MRSERKHGDNIDSFKHLIEVTKSCGINLPRFIGGKEHRAYLERIKVFQGEKSEKDFRLFCLLNRCRDMANIILLHDCDYQLGMIVGQNDEPYTVTFENIYGKKHKAKQKFHFFLIKKH